MTLFAYKRIKKNTMRDRKSAAIARLSRIDSLPHKYAKPAFSDFPTIFFCPLTP